MLLSELESRASTRKLDFWVSFVDFINNFYFIEIPWQQKELWNINLSKPNINTRTRFFLLGDIGF